MKVDKMVNTYYMYIKAEQYTVQIVSRCIYASNLSSYVVNKLCLVYLMNSIVLPACITM